MRHWLTRHGLVAGLVVVLGLAAGFPGRHDPAGWVALSLVVGIFLLSGYALPAEELGRSLRSGRAHLFIQAFSFVLVPVLVWGTLLPFRNAWGEAVVAGVYALACLPTTVSSCVAFTHTARGNTATALFNSVLGNALGVLLTPVLLTLLLGGEGMAFSLTDMARVWRDLFLKLVLPFAAGQGFRLLSRVWAHRLRGPAMSLTTLLLLSLVFLVFAESLHTPAFRAAILALPGLLGYLAVLHVALLVLAGVLGRAFGLNRGDWIAALFAAPQKTLGLGAPLITAYFADRPDLTAVAMLPLLFYHPLQLLVAGLVAGRLRVVLPDDGRYNG
jgi:sodium/bile acid cotransporter 7